MIPVPDDWKTVARETTETLALLKRDYLQGAGIPAVLRGNKASSTAGAINELNISWDNPLSGVEVRVHKNDALLAREILESFEINRATDDDGYDENIAEGELSMDKWARFARYGAIAFVVLGAIATAFWLFSTFGART